MKFKIAIMLLMVLFLTTGCDFNPYNIEDLLLPPKLSDEQQYIDAALSESIKGNYNLVYPRSGEYKSAFIMKDIDGDDMEEAIAFYRKNNSLSNTSSLRITFLNKDTDNDKWYCEYDLDARAGSGVDKLIFVSCDNKVYIAVTYDNSASTDNILKIYAYSNDSVEEIFSTNCIDFTAYDMNLDGTDEIIYMSALPYGDNENYTRTKATMIRINDGGVETMADTYMNSSTTSYLNMYNGFVGNNTPAIYLDAQIGNRFEGTEILMVIGNELVNMMSDDSVELFLNTYRMYGYSSMDLDSDKIYEIPSFITVPGYENVSEDERLYYINWQNYERGELVKKFITYVDYPFGYLLNVPEEWLSKVTVKLDKENNELSFYEYKDASNESAKILFTIKVFTRTDWESQKDTSAYNLITYGGGQLVYTCKVYKNSTQYDVSLSDVTNMFGLLESH